jgi:predicted amidohydrolase YtcJ
MLIRDARLWPAPNGPGSDSPDAPTDEIPVTDVRIAGDAITEVAPGLRRAAGDEDVIDADGCALLPGLHDHHIHLRALAAARASVFAGPPDVRTAAGLAQRLKEADASAPEGQWLRCTGYHESVAGDLDRYVLDRLVPHRPVRVQHRTGALWIVNSAAAEALRLGDCDLSGAERDNNGVPTGRLWRLDRWLAGRAPSSPPDLGAVSAEAASLGITGLTDATPGATATDIETLAKAVANGAIVQRLHCMAPPAAGAVAGEGARSRFTLGPVKILLDDDTLPSLDELTGQVEAAHTAGRPVAVHCVTRVQLILTLTALGEAGRHRADRIEHGAVIPPETFAALRGLTVVTQPHFATERAEQYARDVDPVDLPDLWRLRSLIEAGIPLAAGSDAPFGGASPWLAAPASPRRIAPGHPADLALLRVPPEAARRSLDAGQADGLVAATFIAGHRVC